MKNSLVKKLKNMGVVEKGSFVLHSGAISKYYLDIKKAYGNPHLLRELAHAICKKLRKRTTCLAAAGHGGIPLASIISLNAKLPLILVREEVKNHGRENIIDGYIPTFKDRVALIDDVYSTGSSARNIASILEEEYSARIDGLYVLVSRAKEEAELSFPVVALLDEEDLLE